MQPYRVLREMMGDRFYKAGETRVLSADDAAHLLALGIVAPLEAAPAEPTETPEPAKPARVTKRKG